MTNRRAALLFGLSSVALVLIAAVVSGQISRKYDISMVLMVRLFEADEALENLGRLVEWIEYHRELGVDHFYIYDNAQTPAEQFGEHPIIRWYIAMQVVTYEAIPFERWSNELQLRVYRKAATSHRDETRWISFMDMDEYIRLLKHDTLHEFMTSIEPKAFDPAYDGKDIANFAFACWFFNGHLELSNDPNQLTIEAYQHRTAKPIPIPSRAKNIGFLPNLDVVQVHTLTFFLGKSFQIPPSTAHFNHYWKQRQQEVADVHYVPEFASKFGPVIRERINNLCASSGVPRNQLTAKPFPLLPTQQSFDLSRSRLPSAQEANPADVPAAAPAISHLAERINKLKLRNRND